MVKLVWTDQSIADLRDIGDYIAQDSEQHAKFTVKKIFERVNILKEFPQAGRIVPEKNEETIRELIEGSYRIIYEITPDNIISIVTIHHSSKELKHEK